METKRPTDAQQAQMPRHAVTLKDIAEHCHVSIATVSRALRDHKFHNKDTTQRILEAAKELGYDPTLYQGARKLVLSRFGKDVLNHLVGLFLPALFYKANYFSRMFEGIWDVMTPEGYGLITVRTDARELSMPPSFNRGDIDGLIISSSPQLYPKLRKLIDPIPSLNRRPIVSLMTNLPETSVVNTDCISGAYLAAKHLLELGHRHFAYFFPSHNKLAGYEKAMREYGLNPAEHLHPIRMSPEFEWASFTAEVIPTLATGRAPAWMVNDPLIHHLKAHPQITAILADNDPSAILSHHIVRYAGMRVPDDISIIGFDDTDPLWDENGENMLSTIHVPLEEIGRQAAHLVVDRITGKIKDNVQITFPTSLIVRGTTAPPPNR